MRGTSSKCIKKQNRDILNSYEPLQDCALEFNEGCSTEEGKECHNVPGLKCSEEFPTTAVKPGIYGLAFTMGKCFLTDNSATVGRILMISSADPHEIFDRYSIPYSQGWSRSAHRAVLD